MFPGLGFSLRWKEHEKKEKPVFFENSLQAQTHPGGDLNSVCVWLKNFQAKMPGKQKKKADIVSVILDETHIKALLNNATS